MSAGHPTDPAGTIVVRPVVGAMCFTAFADAVMIAPVMGLGIYGNIL